MFRSLASIFLLPSLPSFPPIPLPFLFLFSVKESDFNQELQSAPATKGVVVVIALSKLAFSDIKKLAEFLCSRQRLVGVNIRGDLTRLKNDFPLAGFDFQVAQILELPQLASDVLRIPLKNVKSLENLFEVVFPGTSIYKKLCHPEGVRKVNWDLWPLKPAEIRIRCLDRRRLKLKRCGKRKRKRLLPQ